MAQAFSISYGELAAMMNAALRDVFTMMLHSSIKLEPWTEPPTVAAGVEQLFGNDAVGEFTNISIGGFKNQLSQFGFPCSLTLPSILRGKSLSVEPVSGCVRKTFLFKVRGKPILSLLIIKED